MTDYSTLVAIGIIAAIAIPIVLLVSAVLLRAAVHLHNRCVGGPESDRSVPQPSLKKAMGIAVLIVVSNALISTVFNHAIGHSVDAGWLNSQTELKTLFPSFIAEFLVMSVVLAYLLPTRFSRALGVSVCHTGICVFVAAVTVFVGIAGAAVVNGMM